MVWLSEYAEPVAPLGPKGPVDLGPGELGVRAHPENIRSKVIPMFQAIGRHDLFRTEQ
jgi:hypothetical protein